MALKRTPSRVDLEIGELRLTGFGARDGRRIGRVVERELARLMARADVPGPVSVERVNAGSLRFAAGTKSEIVGARIAGAVFRRLTGVQE
jgi:hypothetical protein